MYRLLIATVLFCGFSSGIYAFTQEDLSPLSEQQREDLREAVKEDDRPLVYEILGIGSLKKRELIDAAREDDWKNLRSLLEFPSEESIRMAIQYGDTDSIIQWLDIGDMGANSRVSAGWTALMAAAYYGQKSILELLITRGADVDFITPVTGSTALGQAMYGGNIEIVHTLLDEGATAGRARVFEFAARYGYDNLVYRLMDSADLGTRHHELRNAAARGHDSVVDILIPAIIDAGGDLDHTRLVGTKTALQLAHENGHDDIVNALQTAGAKGPSCYEWYGSIFSSCRESNRQAL